MSKMKANCTWSLLTPEQRDELERWLFDENMSYREARERVQKEWGVAASIWSVGRFYQSRVNERSLGEVTEGQDTTKDVNGTGTNLDDLCTAFRMVAGTKVLEKAMAGAELKDLAALGRLIADTEWVQVQHRRLALARDRFEFNAAKAALEKLSNMEEINKEDLEREEARLHAIRVRLFGKNYPR
jgi:hypothetical protein